MNEGVSGTFRDTAGRYLTTPNGLWVTSLPVPERDSGGHGHTAAPATRATKPRCRLLPPQAADISVPVLRQTALFLWWTNNHRPFLPLFLATSANWQWRMREILPGNKTSVASGAKHSPAALASGRAGGQSPAAGLLSVPSVHLP